MTISQKSPRKNLQNNKQPLQNTETMEEKKVSTLFEDMRDDVTNYITNSLELGKLTAYEKISKGSSNISYFIVVGVVIFLTVFLLLITLALYLGQILGNMWAGFGIVSVALLLILLILVLAKKSLKKTVTNRVVNFLMEQDDENDNVKAK